MTDNFQTRVADWMLKCFSPTIAMDKIERCDRFFEEATELVQTNPAFTAERAHALVDYVFGRPVGKPVQEIGGVMVTLAAWCHAHGLDMDDAAELELDRILSPEIMEKIRAKQAVKPTGSALPMVTAKPFSVPDEMNEDLGEILGLMLWRSTPIAHAMQAAGYPIPKKSEVEQAYVLHWLLRTYAEHRQDWRQAAGAQIKQWAEAMKTKEGQANG